MTLVKSISVHERVEQRIHPPVLSGYNTRSDGQFMGYFAGFYASDGECPLWVVFIEQAAQARAGVLLSLPLPPSCLSWSCGSATADATTPASH